MNDPCENCKFAEVDGIHVNCTYGASCPHQIEECIFRIVKPQGNSAHIQIPKKHIGKRIRAFIPQ